MVGSLKLTPWIADQRGQNLIGRINDFLNKYPIHVGFAWIILLPSAVRASVGGDQLGWFLLYGLSLAIPTFLFTLICSCFFKIDLDKKQNWRWWHLPLGQIAMVLTFLAFDRAF